MTTATEPTTAELQFGKRTAPFRSQRDVEKFVLTRGYCDREGVTEFAVQLFHLMPDGYVTKPALFMAFEWKFSKPIPAELLKTVILALDLEKEVRWRTNAVWALRVVLEECERHERDANAMQTAMAAMAATSDEYAERYREIATAAGLKVF